MIREAARGLVFGALCSGLGGVAMGQPIFTVQNGGPSGLSGAGLYSSAGGTPMLVGGVGGMGLPSMADDISALSRRHTVSEFIVCTSVDPTSVGKTQGAPPSGLPPFNVADQAGKNQVPGDVFAASKAYSRATGLLPSKSLPVDENYLMVNQSAPYPQQLALQPNAGPTVTVPAGTPADNVDGILDIDRTMRSPLTAVYFSVALTSPSLGSLGGVSAADVFFDPDPTVGGNESMFASFAALGLGPMDSIDSLAVFDDNSDGVFDGTDSVILSLGRGSPTLSSLGFSAADLLEVGPGGLHMFANHSELGLLAGDNVDALELDELIDDSAYKTLLAEAPSPGGSVLLCLGACAGLRRRR